MLYGKVQVPGIIKNEKKIIRFKMKKRRYGGSIIINERRWREEAGCVVL